MRKLLVWLMLFFLSTDLCSAQIIVSGQVRDEKDSAVSFATVTEKGTLNSVTADQEGYYHIQVSAGAALIFTAAEHQSKTFQATSDILNVVLPRDENMQSVIVTALGISRSRNKVPYAAQQIGGKEVSQNRSANFVENLSGRIAGLDIKQGHTMGGSTNIILRGYSSITQDNQAIVVVDGIPYSNANRNWTSQQIGNHGYDYGSTVSDINPDDIKSITVLKGAAATALYGSRGANGVILVTTKKGRNGLGITINAGIEWGKVDKSTFPTFQQKYGGGYGPYYEDESGYFLYRDPSAGYDYTGSDNSVLAAPSSDDASYGHAFDPNLTVLQWDAFYPGSPTYGLGRPWVAAANGPYTFFESPLTFNENILIEGGSEKANLKFGYTRIGDKGILPNSELNKNLLNFSGTLNITDRFSVSTSANYSNISGKGRFGTGYGVDNMMTNFRQWWPMNVDLSDQRDAYFRTKQNISWNIVDPTDPQPYFWDNVYFSRYESFEADSHNRLFGNVQLNYKLGKYLDIMGRVSLDSWNEIQEERNAVGSVVESYYSRVDLSYRETNYDLLLNFDKDLSSKINLQALLGGNIRKQHTTSLWAITNSGLVVPGLYTLSNSKETPTPPLEREGNLQVNGIFAGATFTWNDRVILDATIRGDASSTLPKDNNVYYYPSVSLGYIFSESLQEWDWFSYGKLRASYAQVGNDAPLYSVHDTYDINPSFGSVLQASVRSTKNNADLRPERTRSFEGGFELAFLKNRLGFDFTYYNNRSFDQILPIFVSTATGYTSKYLNAATVTNKGVELSAYVTPVQGKNFKWDINLNWSRNRNRVEELFEGSENIIIARAPTGAVTINATLGKPYGTIRGNDFVYTNGQPTVNARGRYKRTNTSNEIIGNINPDWLGGINNRFRYKDITFSFLIDARKGGDIFSMDLYYGMGTGLYPETAGQNELGNPSRDPVSEDGGVIMPGVKEDGSPNDIRVNNSWGTFGDVYNPPSQFVYDGSYVKLREAILTYSLPPGLISKIKPVRGIDLSLIGRNLWIIHKNLPYADPEEIISSGNIQGYQVGAFPSVRRFVFNIKLTF